MYWISGLTIAAQGLIHGQVGLQRPPWLLSKYMQGKRKEKRNKDDRKIFGFEIFNTFA